MRLSAPLSSRGRVKHLDRAVSSDLDIGGLQVSMNDALLSCAASSLGDLACDGYCFFSCDCTPRDAIGERIALGEFHHERGRTG